MKKILVFFLLVSTACFSQGKYRLLSAFAADADFFTTDNQGNIYVVKKDQLIKYNREGKQLYKYSNKKYGDITFVDASNMLKVLVYCRDFSQVVFLDNTLSLNGEPVSFDKIGLQQVALVCSSFNNGLWIYNQQNFSLAQLNTSYETIHHVDNLNSVLNMELQPDCITEHDNRIYMNNPATGILIFDIYGTYYKTVPVKNVKAFQVIGDWIYYMRDQRIKAYNIKTTEESEFNVPEAEFSGFRLEVGSLFLQTPKGISVYAPES
jgi:hypothetical protein